MSKYKGLGKLATRIGFSIFIGVAGGYLVAQSINKANAADLPANQELLVKFLIHRDVSFLAIHNGLIVYADEDGNFPEWLTCNYIHANISDVPLDYIVVKDYTASKTLRTEFCK